MLTMRTAMIAGTLLTIGLAWQHIGQAAASFDGHWTGTSTVSGPGAGKGSGASACTNAPVDVMVAGDRVRGSALLDGSYYLVEGKLHEDGTVSGTFSEDSLKGKFEGGRFTGTAVATNGSCTRTINLSKS